MNGLAEGTFRQDGELMVSKRVGEGVIKEIKEQESGIGGYHKRGNVVIMISPKSATFLRIVFKVL